MIRRPFSTAMIDMLLGTVVLLLILINPPLKTETTPALGDFKLEMAWHDEVNVDMDMYLQLPDKRVVYYSYKNQGYAYITRDDRGLMHGENNFETLWIEPPKDGQYCTTIHNFSMGPSSTRAGLKQRMYIAGDVEVRLTDDNANLLYKMVVPMPYWKEETRMFCFDLEDGEMQGPAYPNPEYIKKAGKAEAEANGL